VTEVLRPTDVLDLLRELLRSDSGRPRLTWYGADGEWVELSAKVLGIWVAKSANFLFDDLGVGRGSGVVVDLPTHWRTVPWVLATWSVGATVVLLEDGVDPIGVPDEIRLDAVVSTDPARWIGPGPELAAVSVVGVALPALAREFGPDLPLEALDGATEVQTQDDVFTRPGDRPEANDPALIVVTPPSTPGRPAAGDVVLTYGDLLPTARRALQGSGWPAGVRLLTDAGPVRAAQDWLPALLADVSLVLHPDLAALSPAELDVLVGHERVTATSR
jgi:uncharacterized protein (TIGR03089 family)